jgi:hypothetical protein
MGARLERSYRRLLRAYPRWYRRERGAELSTTLLDAAPPDRSRPAWRDALDIVHSGLRCRLRPPRGIGYRLTVAVLALFAGLGGLAVAGLVSRPAPPTEAQSRAVAATAFAARPAVVAGPDAPCGWCPTWDGGPLPRADAVAVGYRPRADDVPALMAQARDRLAGAGWRVGPLVDDEESTLHFTASRGGLAITVNGRLGTAMLDKNPDHPDPAAVPVTLVATRALPMPVLAAGFLGGLLAGWLVSAWVLQCLRRHRRAVRVAIRATGIPVLVVAGAVDAFAAQWAVGLTVFGSWSPGYLRAPALGLAAAPLPALAIGAVVVATAVLAALPPRRLTATTAPGG